MSLRFNVCDLNAIETRVGAWLAGCTTLMDVFVPCFGPDGKWAPNGRDPYIDFAAKMFCRTYDSIYLDSKSADEVIKAAAKLLRQTAKPGVLGAIYRLGGGAWGNGKSSYIDPVTGKKVYDRVRTGLWGYAWNMGVEMTQEQAHMVVRMFREVYKEIPEFWKTLEMATQDVMRGSNTVRRVGPNGCVTIDKLNIEDRHSLMRMQLPSGRRLHYLDARIEMCTMPWKKADSEENDQREALVYAGSDQVTGQWDIWVQTHGGKLFENLVQAIARDVLAVKLMEFEENDLPVVGHVHDEGICLVTDDPFSPGVEDMVRIMSKQIDWAPGLLLGADGFEDNFYHK